MAKTRIAFVCQKCGRTSPREMGRCPGCGEWGTMVEQVVAVETSVSMPRWEDRGQAQPVRLSEVEGDPWERFPLPIEEFARVLGGGVVPGSLILIGGEPGIGKSTLLLQVAALMADLTGAALYISGEESARQLKLRAERLGIITENLYLLTETNLDVILGHVESLGPQVLVVDSIQTVYTNDLTSMAGNVSQVRECATRLQRLAKNTGITVFLVGHVTKEGGIAGPRVLEHIADTVLYLEGDAFQAFRLLRSIKNRFGATSEVGVFEMRGGGMVEVPNPSEAFLADRVINAPGSAIVVTMEGTRPLLAEIQALATITSFANPRRTANGVDFNRLLLLTAVLTRRVGIRLAEQDVFVNVIGGLRIDEPAADLAIALAIASSVRDIPLPADMVAVGEVGLSGELRAVGQLPARLNEASKLGFRGALIPKSVRRSDELLPEGIDVLAVRSVGEAMEAALDKRGGRW